MNGRFKRMLEPGERILVRSTDGSMSGYGMAFALIVFGGIAFRNLLEFDLRDIRFFETLAGLLLLLPLIVLGWFMRLFRDSWAITNQRIVELGPGAPDGAPMPVNAIEEARLENYRLVLRGFGREISLDVPRNFDAGERLNEIFGDRLPLPGIPVRELNEMLEPDERVIGHAPPLWTEWLRWPMLLAGPAAAVAIHAWPGVGAKFFLAGPWMAVMFYGIFFSDIVAFWRSRGWRTVLTDRRLLRRRPGFISRGDAIPLDAITEADYDGNAGKLVLRASGENFEVFCLKGFARRFLEMLERIDAKSGAAR